MPRGLPGRRATLRITHESKAPRMMKVYYKSKLAVAPATAFLFWMVFVTGGQACAQNSVKAAAVESHEGMTVSASPWTSADLYKEKFAKNSPFKAGIVAIQLSFRNDSNQAVKV